MVDFLTLIILLQMFDHLFSLFLWYHLNSYSPFKRHINFTWRSNASMAWMQYFRRLKQIKDTKGGFDKLNSSHERVMIKNVMS